MDSHLAHVTNSALNKKNIFRGNDCYMCSVVSNIQSGKNANLIKEFSTGFAVLFEYQFYKGYTLFISKEHATELHLLKPARKAKFLEEMSVVAEAVFNAFKPAKLNYELLGNAVPHLHWHIIPRYKNESWKGPVWILDEKIRQSEKTKPAIKKITAFKKAILKYL